jgi:hypothetical protein
LEHVLLAIMDISARVNSLPDKPRTGYQGHQGSYAPGRPILHRRFILSQTSAGNSCKSGYVTITSLLRFVPLFGWEPFLRPGLRMQRRAERKGRQGWPSR